MMFNFLNKSLDISQKTAILSVWVEALQKETTKAQMAYENKRELLSLLEKAKKDIENEVFDELFVDPQPKIDWQKLCELAEQTLENEG